MIPTTTTPALMMMIIAPSVLFFHTDGPVPLLICTLKYFPLSPSSNFNIKIAHTQTFDFDDFWTRVTGYSSIHTECKHIMKV